MSIDSDLRQLVLAARAGIENLTPGEVSAELDKQDALLVDVREPVETAAGVIPTAMLVPRGVLERCAVRDAWPGSGARIILYSGTGSRSALAAGTLQQLGCRDVAHLDGGYRRWLAEGRTVLAPQPRVNPGPYGLGPGVVCAVPHDRPTVLRVRFADEWVGDLLARSSEQRGSLLDALCAGNISVEPCSFPEIDLTELDTSPERAQPST